MRRRSHSLLFVAFVIVFWAPQLFGAEEWPSPDAAPPGVYAQNAKNAKNGEERVTKFSLDKSKQLGVIIEFNEPPLLESRRTNDVRVASASLDALTERLAMDLARIEREVPGRVASTGAESAIRHAYKLTFAGASATVSRQSLAAIRALPYVRRVHEDQKVEMYLAASVPHIGVPQVRAKYGRRGKDIVVAIIDTGVNFGHKALGDGFGPGFKVAGGWDFVNNDAVPMDDHGHGSHVAGIVAANSDTLTGIAPDATLLAYKVLDSYGGGTASLVLAGVERAIDPNNDGDPSDHADVVNMSLGGPATANDPVIAAVERGAAAGVVFCLAAGNNGVVGSLGSPAMAPSAITVAASDLEDKIAYFSSGGPVGGTWAGLKPEVAAPGVKIVSSVLGHNRTVAASGTSMAAPHVAGVAALLLEQHPEWTPGDVKAAIVASAKPILSREDQREGMKPGRNIAFAGAGRIDALAAMEATLFSSKPGASFGIIKKKNEPWTASTTVTLTNRSASAETLTVQTPAVPTGATLTVIPESVTLAAGASAELQLELDVTAEAEPNDSNVLIAGVLELKGANTSAVLPWTIVKADVIQVTFTGTEEFDMYLSNGADPAAMWPAGPRAFGALIPRMLSSDVMILTQPTETQDARFLLRERQTVDGFTEVILGPDDAPYRVSVDSVDVRGIPLDQIGPSVTGRLWHRFTIPSGALIEIEQQERRALNISNFKETLFRTYETRASGTDRYFAAYRHLRNVKQDEVLRLRSSDWASQKIRALCREPECVVRVGAGLSAGIFYTYYSLPPGTNEFTLHITPSVDPRYDFRAYVFVREKGFTWDDESTNPWTFMSNSLRNVNGRFSTSPFGRVSGAEYFPPDRESVLVLGDGPSILRTAVGAWFIQVEPYGSAGEYFGREDARDVSVDIERLDGPVTVYPHDKRLYGLGRPTPGIYRLTATDDYRIAGREGRLTQVSNYDSRVAPTGAPSLSTMRIEDGRGVATTVVKAGSLSRLVFAARQSQMTTNASWDVKHARLDAGATQAWWRPHGTVDWIPLDVTFTGEDYEWKGEFPGSPGSLYAASLSQAVVAEGEVDLKFFLKDLSGGTTEAVYEPAFIVGPAGTRRRVMR